MELNLYILIGPVGAGKSTYARKLYKQNPESTVRICLDDIIQMASFYNYDPQLDDYYRDIETSAIVKGLLRGMDVIVDRTNLTRRHRERFIKIGKTLREMAVWLLQSELQQSIKFEENTEIAIEQKIERFIEKIENESLKSAILSSIPEISGVALSMFPSGVSDNLQKLKKLKIIGVYFKTPYEVCLERRLNDPLLSVREVMRKINWREVLDKMMKIFEPPSLEEGFDELIEIE